MFAKLFYIFVTLCVSLSIQESLKVSLYYESMCPYSKKFILNYLYPGYQKLGDNLEVDLVPLGLAMSRKNGNQIEWSCQHGPLECYINKINACAINLNSTQSDLMTFINCVTKNSTRLNTSDVEKALAIKCADDSNLSWNNIDSCLNTELADNLELAYEIRQNTLVPELMYVPHIRFNDKFDKELEDDAKENFLGTACKLFKLKPKVCQKLFFKINETSVVPKKKIDPKKNYFNDVLEMYHLFKKIIFIH